ncbi:MAG: hypothetical protein ACOC32_04580 [Nanoarchaeota archaeon]
MDRLNPVAIGLSIKDALHGTFAYAFTSLADAVPQFLRGSLNWLHAHAFPFIFQHSAFVMLGILGFTFLSSSMVVSNALTDSRKELLRLATESKVADGHVAKGRKHTIPKKYENIYVIAERRLGGDELHARLEGLMELTGLDEPHFSLGLLVDQLLNLNHHIAFHDHSELEIKDKLLGHGWNFNLINQAFMVIDMELCNEIAGAYKLASFEEIAASMRSLKELAAKGYTQKKIERYLKDAGQKQSDIDTIFKKIYKVQELHTKMKKNQERRIRRALRLNMVHPSMLTDGNYNS